MTCNETYSIPNDGTIPFDLYSLYTIQTNIFDACPNDTRLGQWKSGIYVLTALAVTAMTGSPTGFPAIWAWTTYPQDLVLSRFLTWKLPLFQLIMQLPRPPHRTRFEVFSLVHLMGDPVDSIASLMLTLHVTQRRLKRLERCSILKGKELKELVLLIGAYEVWGDKDNVAALEKLFNKTTSKDMRGKWTSDYRDAAQALAADRETKFLPVLTAVAGFLISIGLSYGRTMSEDWDSRSPRHVELHNIAFGLTLAGCLPAVILAAFVGVPQSRRSIPRILFLFETAHKMTPLEETTRPKGTAQERGPQKGTTQEGGPQGDTPHRYRHLLNDSETKDCLDNGVIPSWRYDRWPWTLDKEVTESKAREEAVDCWLLRELVAALVVLVGSVGAVLLSFFVPPTGCMSCRPYAEIAIGLAYIVSYAVGAVLAACKVRQTRWLFWLTMAKDVVATMVVTVIILLTVAGSLNKPSCWESCDGSFLLLPETTREDLEAVPVWLFPVIIFTTLAVLVAAGFAIALSFGYGVSVYLQRDDETDRGICKKASDD